MNRLLAFVALYLLTGCPSEGEDTGAGETLPACCYSAPSGVHFQPSDAAPRLPYVEVPDGH